MIKKQLLLVLLLFFISSPAYARYVAVSWDAVAGATSYTLYWGAESGMNPWTYYLDVGNVTEYQLAINEETTYLVVTATNGDGEGPESDEVIFPYPLSSLSAYTAIGLEQDGLEQDGLEQDGYPTIKQISVFLPDDNFPDTGTVGPLDEFDLAATELVQDGYSTPEQISVLLTDTGTNLPYTMTASMRYKKSGGAWVEGHDLYHIDNSYTEHGFAWVITGLDQGSTYTVEVTTNDGGDEVVYTKDMTTASLPAAAGAVTTTITAGSTESQIQTILGNARPGDVIQFENGTYEVDTLTMQASGTEGNPIYVRGESRDGVILHDDTDYIFRSGGEDYFVLENMTLRGTGVDNGATAVSKGIAIWGGYDTENDRVGITLRNLNIEGVDYGIRVTSNNIRQLFIYENVIEGNNTWTQDYYRDMSYWNETTYCGWIDNAPTNISYVDSDTFTVDGDFTDIYKNSTPRTPLKINDAGTYVFSTIGSSSYADGTTTINLEDAVLTGGALTEVLNGDVYESGPPGVGDCLPDIDDGVTWGDDGLYIGGNGNVAFNNTLSGFGDTLAVQGGSPSANLHFYRNDILMSGDDALEADYGTRNITFYDNRIKNTMTCLSIDQWYGGPFIGFRNICLNVGRQVLKLGGTPGVSGQFFYNNTFVYDIAEVTGFSFGLTGSPFDYFGFQNNLIISPADDIVNTFWVSSSFVDHVDFTNNGWYPDERWHWTWDTTETYGNLASIQAGIRPEEPVFSGETLRHKDDYISELQPFETPIVLDTDYHTELTVGYIPILDSGSVNKGAGVAITGVTDGYSGAAPDTGAIIGGRSIPTYGATTDGEPVGYKMQHGVGATPVIISIVEAEN